MAEANGRNGDASGEFSFARYFPERPVSDEVDLECGTADALDLLAKDSWISQKLCGGQREDESIWPPVVPVKQAEPAYRSKTPRWSAANLPEAALRNVFLTCAKKPTVRSTRREKLLAESLCNETSCAAANTPTLGNCLAVFEEPGKADFVTAAFPTGSQARTLVVGLFKACGDQDSLQTFEQVSAVDWRFDSEIVQVELLEKLDQPCCLLRLSQPPRAMLVRLQSDHGRTDLSSTPFIDQALHVGFSPHVAGEYFAITPFLVRVGSLVSSEAVCMDIPAETSISFGDWSAFPSCIVLGGKSGLVLWDTRRSSSGDPLLVRDNVSCLHCLKDNRTFVLYATDASVKLIDVRMAVAPIIQWKHMLLGCPKFIDYLDLKNHRLGRVREVLVASREANEATAFALLQPTENAALFCGLHPPKVSCCVEDFLLWQQAHRPMVALPQSLRQRFLAPTRGIRALRQGVLIANDVGDLYFQSTIREGCDPAMYNKAFELWNSCYNYSNCVVDMNGFYGCTSDARILHYPPSMAAASKGNVPLGSFLSGPNVQVDTADELLDKQWLEESTADESLGDTITSCFVDQY